MADAKTYTDSPPVQPKSDTTALDAETGQQIVDQMNPAALAHAREELSHLAPGPSEPLHFGHRSTPTQLDEDPISETLPFRESLP